MDLVENYSINNYNNQFILDDLIVDFPNNDIVLNDAFFHNVVGSSGDSCNSSISGSENRFSSNVSSGSFSESPFSEVELCLPYDELIELEWLSSFTHESFSHDDIQNQQIVSTGYKAPINDTSSSGTNDVYIFQTKPNIFETNVAVPAKARSKILRSRCRDWTSRIMHLKKPSEIKIKINKQTVFKQSEFLEGCIRRCLHCGSHTTPQWRTGPMGPKTLCNACGVRYKSGRLVPEYRPANSPSYVSAKHSNSHRKVMEIRRQKELRNVDQVLVYQRSALC